MTTFSNITYEELTIGQTASMTRQVTADDVKAFALVTHDYNPAHLDNEYAEQSQFKGVIAHGMWTAGLLSALIGTKFPGLGTIYLNQSLSFRRPVHIDDTLTATLTVKSKDDGKKWLLKMMRRTDFPSIVLKFEYNEDGTPKVILEKRSKRGIWYKS